VSRSRYRSPVRLEVPDGPDAKRAADVGPRPGRCRGLGCVRGAGRAAADGRSPTPATRPGRHPRRRSGGLCPAGDVWRYDGRSFDRDTRRGAVRPLADPPRPLGAACRALQAGPGVETIRAPAFPVQPQEKVEPAVPAGTGNRTSHSARKGRHQAGGSSRSTIEPRACPAGTAGPTFWLACFHFSPRLIWSPPWNPARPGFAASCGL
jgi:hypothetical protein